MRVSRTVCRYRNRDYNNCNTKKKNSFNNFYLFIHFIINLYTQIQRASFSYIHIVQYYNNNMKYT